ncbi:hypothetical protein ACFLXF_01020 [Chloroflexota bacterium]
MEIDAIWFAILGFAFGLAAFLRWIFHDIAGYINKPKLVISHGPFAVDWQSIDTEETRRFVHLEVTSHRGKVARNCVAKARVMRYPPDVTIWNEEFSLHWADTPYSTVSTEAEPVDIRAEVKRLDVAFTTSQSSGQTWLATPLALAVPQKSPQFALPPGEYILQVAISCENGRGDAKTFKLISSHNWQDLQAQGLKE